ncbi:putative MFS family arabinose efflux permease [Mycolicibacterium iranicum]|uniref:Putative MFS family arabinose efflux permease n=1 Tax=Mycolicibacterium iranicum TaxID=912594 RepID=A0A839Q009_MYCIR|nr:YbfB/YjiJ family MFS transporter [Mycolicibacterium iranicum]MBB2989079.1 putative MFS family arabinose efflux permease [Mycolicibacterium iranicum]
MTWHRSHLHIARGAAALAATVGVGRFVYTPILPLMTSQAGLSPAGAGALATANYVGYLAGALAGVASPRLIRSTTTWRWGLVAVVASLALMPMTHHVTVWLAIRAVAGFASAVLFVMAVDWMMDHARGRSVQLPGWGFGGVGLGIALSGVLVLVLPAAGWRATWWAAAALATAVGAIAWRMRGAGETPTEKAASAAAPAGSRRWFLVLLACYTLEGVGYIIAGTFLVAAISQTSPGTLGNGAWLVVGLAAAPSAALWAMASARWSRPTLLVVALFAQTVGIALPALVSGATPALIGAVAFGGTFIGVSTLALAAGRDLAFPGAVAVLTAGYSAGQIVGPLVVTPLLHHGFRAALLTSALIVAAAAMTAAWLRVGCRELSPPVRGADRLPAATRPVR